MIWIWLAGGTAIHSFCPKTKLEEFEILPEQPCVFTVSAPSEKKAASASAAGMRWVWGFWLLLDWISSPAAASKLACFER